MREPTQTWFERRLADARRHPAVVVISLLIATIVGLGTLTDSVDSIELFYIEHFTDSAHIAPRIHGTLPIAAPVPSAQTPASSNKLAEPQSSALTESSMTTPSVAPSAEEVFRTIRDRKLTDLQRSQFIDRTTGEHVRWDGSVRDVVREWEQEKSGPIILVFTPTFDLKSELPVVVAANFPQSAEADLSSLSEGDHISIYCRLDYLHVTEPEPILRDCKLVTFTKSPK